MEHPNLTANTIRKKCQYCDFETKSGNIKKHETACYLNPSNTRFCPVCGNVIKSRKGVTCSYSCSNTYFRSGSDNPNWKEHGGLIGYRRICFEHHGKKCIICGEELIVAVHHIDKDHKNNDPKNLVPLCPTHHQYWHSRYKHLIQEQVEQYVGV